MVPARTEFLVGVLCACVTAAAPVSSSLGQEPPGTDAESKLAETRTSNDDAPGADGSLRLRVRRRIESPPGSGIYRVESRTETWNPRRTALIICDMWDTHTCRGAAGRVAEVAPAMNRTVAAARDKGVLIIHAPSDCMPHYDKTPQRELARAAPAAAAPVPIKWNRWDVKREGEPPAEIVDGGCACDQPCPNFLENEQGFRQWRKGPPLPWTRQIETIEIADGDAISDDGQEIYNLMQQRGIDNVILMGVHTNLCVSGRPFGLRQMAYLGKNVVLCRDLTDALFQSRSPEIDQHRGTALVVRHIERRICPTITSTSISGEPPFRFRRDSEVDCRIR